MRLLIKVYLNNINSYDLDQILDALSKSIVDKDTFIHIMTNDKKVESEFKVDFLNEYRTPIMINHNLSKLEWDLILPITKPLILTRSFDRIIKTFYKNNFNNLDGVLELNSISDDKLYVIGREYYERFGYIYNPVYSNKNFEEEFIGVMNIINKYYSIKSDNIRIKLIEIKSDDDNIYELRKKTNFGIE